MATPQVSRATLSYLLLAFAFVLAVPLAAGQNPAQSAAAQPEKKAVLEKARQTYYILENQGVKSFQCIVQPDWKKFMDFMAQKPTPAHDPHLALLGPVQYSVVVDDQGNAKVTPFLATGGTPDSSLDQIVGGAQQMIAGFFQSWDSMVLSSLFAPSEDDNYTLSERPDGYHLAEKAGEQNIDLLLTKDSLLTTMKVTAPGVIILIQPKYTKIEKGLLMTGLDDDINNGSQKVNLQIQYQTVEGFQMPEKVNYQAVFTNQKVEIEMNFTKYQITKR